MPMASDNIWEADPATVNVQHETECAEDARAYQTKPYHLHVPGLYVSLDVEERVHPAREVNMEYVEVSSLELLRYSLIAAAHHEQSPKYCNGVWEQ